MKLFLYFCPSFKKPLKSGRNKKTNLMLLNHMLLLIRPILEARGEIQKYFRWVFGSNENKKICFRNYPTFSYGGGAIIYQCKIGVIIIVTP